MGGGAVIATQKFGQNISGIEVDKRDLRELQRIMTALAKDAPDKFKDAGKKASEIIAEEARRRVPVDTGRLRDSLRAGATARVPWVAGGNVSAPYFFPIEFGWPARNIEPRDFFYGAIRDKADEGWKQYEKAIDDVLGVSTFG